MAMEDFEKSKFRFSEVFNNTSGKTSGSAFLGIILGLIAGLTWVVLPALMIIFEDIDSETTLEIMKETINLVWASAGLLGIRKLAGSLGKNNPDAA
jgi:hypothetical protein